MDLALMLFARSQRKTLLVFAVICLVLVAAGSVFDLPPLGQALGIVLTLAAAVLISPRSDTATEQNTLDTPENARLPTGFGRALLERLPAPLLVVGSDERVAYAKPAALAL